jgi:hypothetical protein
MCRKESHGGCFYVLKLKFTALNFLLISMLCFWLTFVWSAYRLSNIIYTIRLVTYMRGLTVAGKSQNLNAGAIAERLLLLCTPDQS